MQVQPYLFFDGRCEEAIAFYQKTIGAQINMMMRFKEAPPDACPEGGFPPGTENKVMHAALQIGEATVMASDGHNNGKPNFEGFALSLDAKNDAEAKRMFDALSEGGQVRMPLGKTFFASSFGMLADKFGVGWMVIVPSM